MSNRTFFILWSFCCVGFGIPMGLTAPFLTSCTSSTAESSRPRLPARMEMLTERYNEYGSPYSGVFVWRDMVNGRLCYTYREWSSVGEGGGLWCEEQPSTPGSSQFSPAVEAQETTAEDQKAAQ